MTITPSMAIHAKKMRMDPRYTELALHTKSGIVGPSSVLGNITKELRERKNTVVGIPSLDELSELGISKEIIKDHGKWYTYPDKRVYLGPSKLECIYNYLAHNLGKIRDVRL